MRVRLNKINWTTKRLADGTIKTYWYAWRGGPALKGEPGAPEFIASYNAAVAQDSAKLAVGATLSSLLDYFQSTSEFKNDISAHAGRLYQTNKGHRSRIRRLPAVGARQEGNTRHFQAMA
jgi:hypothetical protein